jgi:hypothetical protein
MYRSSIRHRWSYLRVQVEETAIRIQLLHGRRAQALSDTLPAIIGIREVRQKPTPVQPDNSSTIVISERGYISSRKAQHLATRVAFIKDKMKQGIISLEYTPTDHMFVDILTKAVTGQRFIQHRGYLLNSYEYFR